MIDFNRRAAFLEHYGDRVTSISWLDMMDEQPRTRDVTSGGSRSSIFQPGVEISKISSQSISRLYGSVNLNYARPQRRQTIPLPLLPPQSG
jgi:hypothetical protein